MNYEVCNKINLLDLNHTSLWLSILSLIASIYIAFKLSNGTDLLIYKVKELLILDKNISKAERALRRYRIKLIKTHRYLNKIGDPNNLLPQFVPHFEKYISILELICAVEKSIKKTSVWLKPIDGDSEILIDLIPLSKNFDLDYDNFDSPNLTNLGYLVKVSLNDYYKTELINNYGFVNGQNLALYYNENSECSKYKFVLIDLIDNRSWPCFIIQDQQYDSVNRRAKASDFSFPIHRNKK